MWWQSRTGGRERDKRRWIEKAETEFGAWGTIYYDDDGHALGSMQYGAARLFPARRSCRRARRRTTRCSSRAPT